MPLSEIRNFLLVTPELGTGGQPTEGQLRELPTHGFGFVVNLGLLDPRYCLPDEAGAARACGLEYHHLPVEFGAPTAADFDAFRGVMGGARGRKAFVHCAMNLRVTCFVGLWAEEALGWTRDEAEALIRRFWEPNEVWTAFIEAVRAGR